MNILVKNGNFANVSIGERLLIPTAIAPAVSAFSTLTKAQKLALVNLYHTLYNAGLWTRLKKLYIPVISPSLALSHVNILTGETDWTPTAQFSLSSNGLTEVGDQPSYTGDTIPVSEQSLADITTFAYISKAIVHSATDATKETFGLGLSSRRSRSCMLYGQYQPDINFWLRDSSHNLRQGVTDSSTGDYTLIAGVVDSTPTSLHLAGFGQWFDRTTDVSLTFATIVPYVNQASGKVCLGGYLKISGLMDAITQTEYNTLLNAFKTFDAAL
jgi:hypothetical protein